MALLINAYSARRGEERNSIQGDEIGDNSTTPKNQIVIAPNLYIAT